MASIEATRSELANYIAAHPEQSYRVIAAKLGCSIATVSACARSHGVQRRPRVNLDLSKLMEADNG